MKKLFLSLFALTFFFSASCVNSNEKAAAPQVIQSNATDPVVVVINGQAVTNSEFEKTLSGRDKGSLIKAESEMYQAKMDVLQEYVFQKLVEAEAKKKNISTEEYMKKEVTAKVKQPSEKEIQDFYGKAIKQFEASGKTPPPLNDAVKDQIKQQLSMRSGAERKQALSDELLKKNKVTFALEQPRVEVAKGDRPAKAGEKGKVTIIEFSDFQCPFCKKGASTMESVVKKYGSKVNYYFRDFPLPFHDRAKFAANAARCAGDQGKFWEYHDKLFSDQSKNTDEDFIAYAKELKLDIAKFEPCVKGMKMAPQIDKDAQDGENVGVSGTPAYFINGIFLSGALPEQKFAEVIDQELKK